MIDIARTLSGTIANIMKRERTSRKIRKILSCTNSHYNEVRFDLYCRSLRFFCFFNNNSMIIDL